MARRAAGRSGRCVGYVISTHEHLEEAGIEDRMLAHMVNALSPCRLPRPPDLVRRRPARRRSYGMLKPVPRPLVAMKKR